MTDEEFEKEKMQALLLVAKQMAKDQMEQLARDLVSVQPMGEAMKGLQELYKSSKSREELKAEGYEPVSGLGLMWIKKDD